MLREPRLERVRDVEAQPEEALVALFDMRGRVRCERDRRPYARQMARAQLHPRLAPADQPLDEHFDAAAGEKYNHCYREYRALYPALKEHFEKLGNL